MMQKEDSRQSPQAKPARRNHDKKDKAGTFVAIWIMLILMVGMIPFMPGVSATTSGDIDCAIGVNWYQNYGTWTHDQGYLLPGGAYDRSFFAFNLNSVPTGSTITNVVMYTYVSNGPDFNGYLAMRALDPFTNSTYSTLDDDPGGTPDIYDVAASGLTNGWSSFSNSAITSYFATDFAAHSGWVYIGIRGNGLSGSAAWGMGGDTNTYPNYVVVTYTPPAGTWHPSITSTPGLQYTSGVPYSYHATANTTVGWNTTYGINSEVASWWVPKTPGAGTPQWRNISGNSSLTALVESQRTSLGHADLVLSRPNHPNDSAGSMGWGSAESANPWYMRIYYSGSWSSNITPYEDTSVKVDDPNQTYGSNVAIYANVRSWTALAKFNLSTGGNAITNVELNIYYNYNCEYNGTLLISEPISDSWVESTATWANYLGFSWVNLGSSIVNTVKTNGYFNLTLMNGTTTIPVQIVISMGIWNSTARDTYQNFSIIAISPPTYTSSATTTVPANGAYSYHIVIDNHTYDATFIYENGPAWLTANFNNTIGESFYLNGTAPATNGTHSVSTSSENINGKTWQNFTITVSEGTPATYIGVDITSPANNTAFYNDETNTVWWNYTAGSYAFSHYNISESIDNGSTWFHSFNTTSYAPGLSFSPNPSNHYWYMVKIRGVDIYDYVGAYSYICFNFVDPPPLLITSTPVLDGITNVPYSYQLIANMSATWSQSPSVVTMAGEEPNADSSIFSYNPTANYGALDTLYTYQPTPQSVRAIFMWDSIVIPAGCTITSVVLHLYKTYNAYGGAMEFYGNDNYNWTEMAVTWNNAGTLSLLSGYVVEYDSLGWKSYSTSALSAYCSAQYAASGHITFAMATTNFNAEVYYDSKEGTNHPYLTVTYSNPSFTSINATTGLLTGTPTSPGTYNVSIEAVHNTQHTWQNFTITVVDGWRPTITSTPSPLIMYIGSTWTYAVTANESVTIAIFGNGHMVGNSVVHAGTNHGWDYYYLEVTSVSGGMIAYQNWTIEWRFSWNPTFTSSPGLTGTGGVVYSYTWTANTSVYFDYVSGPAWASVVGTTVSGTPIVLGPYNFVLRLQNVPGDWVYQNWTLVVSTTHFVLFTSTPVLDADNGSYYHYHVTTNIPATVTITFGPSWLGYSPSLKTLAGNCPSYGVYTVTLHAVSTVYGTQANQTFVITASPIIPPLPIDESILLVIPIFMLAILVLICSWSREEGLSGNIFLGSMAIGIGMLATVNAFPIWTLVVGIGILAIMLFRSVRG